jgi:hypothetical protein
LRPRVDLHSGLVSFEMRPCPEEPPHAASRRGAPEEVAKAAVSKDAPPGTSVDHRISVSPPERVEPPTRVGRVSDGMAVP